MEMPGLFAVSADEDLAFLREQGVRTIVSLTERAFPAEAARAHGLEVVWMPIVDFTAPSPEQVDEFCALVDGAADPVVTHCLAGWGRTGTMLGCYLVHCGRGPAEAIAEVRAAEPAAIQTPDQEAAIWAYAERRRA
jgi:atypical dual specificity phosphatase